MVGDSSPGAPGMSSLPLLPLRDLVVFPHMVVPLIIGRARSRAAVEAAVAGDHLLFLTAQHNDAPAEPGADDVHAVGAVALVLQVLRLPDDNLKVLVEGRHRGRLQRVVELPQVLRAEVTALPDGPVAPGPEVEALLRSVREAFEALAKVDRNITTEQVMALAGLDDPGRMADLVIASVRCPLEDRQAVLEETEPVPRLERVLHLVESESEMRSLQKKISARARKRAEQGRKESALHEQLDAAGRDGNERDEFKAELQELERRAAEAPLSAEARDRVDRELRKLRMMSPLSAEATVVRNYVDWVLALPWAHTVPEDRSLPKAAAVLDEDHFGLRAVKDRILEHLAVGQLAEAGAGSVLCLVGPPGVGKTSLARSIARATGRPFVRQALGGVRDEAEIRGHRRTYIGALPGKVIQAMKRAGANNPVLLLDEVDKMSADFRGDPAAALLEVLDPEQNAAFSDHYLDLDYDLSSVLFVCTANSLDGIPVPLRDRLEIIELSGYTDEEKRAIATRYLVARQRERAGLRAGALSFHRDAIELLVRCYTREAGVRGLEREIGRVCRKIARREVERGGLPPLRVRAAHLERLLGAPPFPIPGSTAADAVGLVRGLGVSAVGGQVLEIEVVAVPGAGRVQLTGRLGETLRESALAGITYLRTRAQSLGVDPGFAARTDLHVHYPGASAHADGPSAGVAMVTAIASALVELPVRRSVAMTGEISLQGRVLPVGGIKEKLLAAHRAGVATVLVPAANAAAVGELPARVRAAMEIILVDDMDAILERAIVWPAGGRRAVRRSAIGFGRPLSVEDPAPGTAGGGSP